MFAISTTFTCPDLGRIVVKDANHPEASIHKAAVMGNGPSQVASAHHDHRPFAVYLQDLLQLGLQMADLVACALFAKLTEVRKIFPYLRRANAESLSQLVRRGDLVALLNKLRKRPKVNW
jgi:hypothetical protein